MKSVNEMLNVGRHGYQWLVDLLFGVVGEVLVMLIFILSISDTLASETTDTPQPASAPHALVQVGSASMSMMWLDIYSATLYSADGQYQPNQLPLKLAIEYHRDIDAEDLIDATVDQWQHLGLPEQKINQYREQLVQAWPDVKQGDRLTFMVSSASQAEFLFNDKPYFTVTDLAFPADFLAIWLSENTSRPKLRQQLIGMN